MQAAGAALGGLAGAFSNQKEGGTDAGNALNFGSGADADLRARAMSATDPNNFLAQRVNSGLGYSSGQVQNDPLQGQLFGQNGALSDTLGQIKGLENGGGGLTSQDQTAYGQASGNIARQFGQSGQSLAQSLSDRGLSNSGAAGAQFSGLQGNQNEQLGQLQTQIAQQRENLNQQRLQSMQGFAAQLGNQAQGAINSDRSNNLEAAQNYEQQGAQAANLLNAQQNQANQGLQQQQQTSHGSTLSNVFGGMSSGLAASSKGSGGGMSGGAGGMG